MADFITYLLQKGCSEATSKAYGYQSQRFLSWASTNHIEPEFITYPQLIQYIQHLKIRGIAQNTIKATLTALEHYYNYLITLKLLSHNPIPSINIRTKKIRPLYHILTPEQLQALHTDFTPKAQRSQTPFYTWLAFRKKVTVGLMVHQGLATNDLGALEVKHLDFDKGTLQVPANRKHEARTLPLQPTQIMELYRYLQEIHPLLIRAFKANESFLLLHGHQHFREPQQRLLQRIRKQQPLVTSIRQIRASVIVHWLKSYNLREVQYMAGHKSVQSTEAYLQDDTEGLQQAIDQFFPLG